MISKSPARLTDTFNKWPRKPYFVLVAGHGLSGFSHIGGWPLLGFTDWVLIDPSILKTHKGASTKSIFLDLFLPKLVDGEKNQ